MNDVLRALDEENDRLYKDSSKQNKYDRSDSVNYLSFIMCEINYNVK